ncbi:methylenetetrahydrofolate dehydrogenase [Aureobasidium sp. EXF-12298]|nr:methylenetetrahydrofolate dehydrogenase [Aureobasidium sp. EXF-12298]
MSANPTSCKVVLAANIAKKLQAEVAEGLAKLSRKPHLVGFLANKDPAARMYADWTGKTCIDNGFAFTLREVEREELEEAIREANTDDSVDGILVYYPVFNTSRDRTIQYVVDMHKDVEGLSPKLINNMYQNIRFLDPPHNTQKSILPCTPLAMIKILEYLNIYNTILDYGKRLWGRKITVINRSEVVGRPLAALLANDGAEVYSVDVTGVQRFSRGQGLRNQQHVVEEKPDMTMDDCLAISDVVISGVPGDKFKVPVEKIRDGAVCINFSSEKNFTPQVKEHASIYVPAVGKVTIMILLRNLLVCTAMATYFKSLSPSQLLALKSLETTAEQNTHPLIASEENTSTPPIDSMLSSSILEDPSKEKKPNVELLLEQTADQLQRMVQNNPDVDAKPAEAIEKKGTVEEVVAA